MRKVTNFAKGSTLISYDHKINNYSWVERKFFFFFFFFLLWFNVPVNNFSVMLRRSHLFLGITSTFLGSKCLLLKETNTPTRPRIEPGSPDPESDALAIRPVRPPERKLKVFMAFLQIAGVLYMF